MRGLILALVLGATLRAQAPRPDSQEPAKPEALARFENQLDHFVGSWALSQQKLTARAQAAQKGLVFATPGEQRKYFTELRPVPAATAAEPPRERISLKPGQPCAIPLLNVLRRENVDPKMILPDVPPVDGRIRIIAPPAPSCDDVK